VLIGPAFEDVDLHEGAGLLRQFPRRGALAGREADDHRAAFGGFAGLQRDLFGNIVALVEQAEGRHALAHRGGAIVALLARGRGSRRRGGGHLLVQRHVGGFRLARGVAGGESKSADQRRGEERKPHRAPQPSALPGVQAS